MPSAGADGAPSLPPAVLQLQAPVVELQLEHRAAARVVGRLGLLHLHHGLPQVAAGEVLGIALGEERDPALAVLVERERAGGSRALVLPIAGRVAAELAALAPEVVAVDHGQPPVGVVALGRPTRGRAHVAARGHVGVTGIRGAFDVAPEPCHGIGDARAVIAEHVATGGRQRRRVHAGAVRCRGRRIVGLDQLQLQLPAAHEPRGRHTQEPAPAGHGADPAGAHAALEPMAAPVELGAGLDHAVGLDAAQPEDQGVVGLLHGPERLGAVGGACRARRGNRRDPGDSDGRTAPAKAAVAGRACSDTRAHLRSFRESEGARHGGSPRPRPRTSVQAAGRGAELPAPARSGGPKGPRSRRCPR